MRNKLSNNYFSGSVSQVSNCTEIILYNKSSFSERISLYNLSEFYLTHLAGTSEDYVKKLYRDKPGDSFEYKKLLKDGFNVVVYISPVSNSPIGYSEFINTQGVGISLGIKLNITRTLKLEIEIELKNQLVGKDLSKNYRGSELYQYVGRKSLIDRTYRNLFTSDIGRITTDRLSFIVESSGLITKDGSWKLGIRKDIPISESWLNYSVGFYKGRLVLATWNERSYSLYSLIENQEKVTGTTLTYIKKIEGRYYIDTENKLRQLETGDEIEKTNSHLVCDYTDPRCKVYDLPTFYLKSEILSYIPEINNIYLDLNNYLRSNQVIIHGKIGSWFILERDFGGTLLFYAVSPTTVLEMTEEDLTNAIFVGDQSIIIKEDLYYLVYNTEGTELQTERARSVILNGRLDYTNDGFLFCFLDTDEDEKHYSEYYGDEGYVSLIFKYEELYLTELGKYRRSCYPEGRGIPDIIGSYGGLLFYRYNGKINLL